jgi:hypothetical protein
LYIEAAKSFFNVSREKLSPRPLATEADNLEDFAVKVYTTFFVHNSCWFPRSFSVRSQRESLLYPTQKTSKYLSTTELIFRELQLCDTGKTCNKENDTHLRPFRCCLPLADTSLTVLTNRTNLSQLNLTAALLVFRFP